MYHKHSRVKFFIMWKKNNSNCFFLIRFCLRDIGIETFRSSWPTKYWIESEGHPSLILEMISEINTVYLIRYRGPLDAIYYQPDSCPRVTGGSFKKIFHISMLLIMVLHTGRKILRRVYLWRILHTKLKLNWSEAYFMCNFANRIGTGIQIIRDSTYIHRVPDAKKKQRQLFQFERIIPR